MIILHLRITVNHHSTFIFQYDKDTLQYTLSSKYKFSCFLLEYLHIRLKLLSNNSVFNSLVIHIVIYSNIYF